MTAIKVPFFMGDRISGLEAPEPSVEISPELPAGSAQERMAVVYSRLAAEVARQDDPIVFAGDCVAIIGVLAGLQRKGIDPMLVFFDAHGDFNTWVTTPSGFIGGMPVAMVTGRGEQTIVAGAGLRVLPDARVLHVGARDLDPREQVAMKDSDVTVIAVAEVADIELPAGPLYVHVDLDVVDPEEMTATSYPAPGGPSVEEVIAALGRFAATGRVAACSVSSWNPALPGADRAAAIAARMAGVFG
jgi:arginase